MNRSMVRQVLECGSPLPLWNVPEPNESGRRLPHSKKLSRETSLWSKPSRCRGAILFEVVLALVLLAGAATIIFGGLSASVDAVEQLKLSVHAENLALSVAAELQMGIRSSDFTGPGPFEPPFENWDWEFQLASFETQSGEPSQLKSIEVIIRHTDPEVTYRLTQNLWLAPSGQLSAGIAAPTERWSSTRASDPRNRIKSRGAKPVGILFARENSNGPRPASAWLSSPPDQAP